MAQRIARCGPSNIARKPSPDVFTSRASKACELCPDDGVVRIKQGMPLAVTDLRGLARRVHDVGEEHRGEDTVVGHVCVVAGEELGDLLRVTLL